MTLPTQFSEPWAAGPDDQGEHQESPCGNLDHEWMVHLRVDYITAVHAVSAAAAKEHAETLADNGEYNLGEVAEAIDAWRRDPMEIYGTPEHEAWLMEMERREG